MVTINSQPGGNSILTAYRHVLIRCSSNDSTIVKFKAEIFIGTVATGTKVATLIVDQEINGANFEVDLQGILKNQVGFHIADTTGGGATNASNSVAYQIQVKLIEVLKSGNIFVDGESINTNIFHATNQLRQFTETKDIGKLIFDENGKPFLTKEPNSITRKRIIRETDIDFLGLLLKDVTYTTELIEVNTYDSGGSFIERYTITGDTADRIMVHLAVGPKNLNNSTLVSGSQPVIDAAVDSYSIEFKGNVGLGLIKTDIFWYGIDRKCHNDTLRVVFLNSLGAWDSFFFFGTQREDFRQRQTTYHKLLQNAHVSTDRGIEVLSSVANDEYQVYSQLLSDADKRWLPEFIMSQQVFKDISDEITTKYESIIITDRKFKVLDTDKEAQLIRFKYRTASGRYSHIA